MTEERRIARRPGNFNQSPFNTLRHVPAASLRLSERFPEDTGANQQPNETETPEY